MTARPTARPGPLGHGEQDGERAVRRFVTVLAVTVGGLCFLFSLGNVYQLAVDLELWVWIRPLVAPAVDLSLVALVVGIRFLARRGVSGAELRRPRLFMLAVGLAAWALNTAHAVAERDWGKAAFDSLAPGLLIGWAEVLPWFLRQFQAVTHPAGADSRPPVPIPTAPPPADDNTPIPAAAPDGGVPAVPLPGAAPVAVPPCRPRQRERAPAPSGLGQRGERSRPLMPACGPIGRPSGPPGGPRAGRSWTGYAAGTPATAPAARPAPATCGKRPPAASTPPNPFPFPPATRPPLVPVPFPPLIQSGPVPFPPTRATRVPLPQPVPSRPAPPLPFPPSASRVRRRGGDACGPMPPDPVPPSASRSRRRNCQWPASSTSWSWCSRS